MQQQKEQAACMRGESISEPTEDRSHTNYPHPQLPLNPSLPPSLLESAATSTPLSPPHLLPPYLEPLQGDKLGVALNPQVTPDSNQGTRWWYCLYRLYSRRH